MRAFLPGMETTAITVLVTLPTFVVVAIVLSVVISIFQRRFMYPG